MTFPPASCEIKDLLSRADAGPQKKITLHGYLGHQRDASKGLTFVELTSIDLSHSVQLVASTKDQDDPTSVLAKLRSLGSHVPVSIQGSTKSRAAKPADARDVSDDVVHIPDLEIKLSDILPLNDFASDINITEGTVIPPQQRHLQIRTDKKLRDAIELRSRVHRAIASMLYTQGFTEIETPLLFKSTPEGAREFLVPTRSKGYAYALPQSPQQYKQILMASGIPRYMQFAKCFRDEDLRADRQPEFTQLDIEMAFATGADVMDVIESVVQKLWKSFMSIDYNGTPFARMTYEEAMSSYGSDKPDLRIGSKISRIDYLLPVDLVGKVTHLDGPVVEVMNIPVSEDPTITRKFVSSFMDSADSRPFNANPHGQPGIFIYDSRKPLGGLQPFGFEAAEVLEETLSLEEGDLVVIQARPNTPFAGAGSTMLGNLRLALHRRAVAANLLPKPTGFEFLWVTDFPLFSPAADNTSTEPGQGGTASGLRSTHHPFTSPKTAEDVDILLTDPSAAIADHYDLVVNGVELGGGSRRIHNAAMQTLVLRDVLGMSDDRLKDFEHLIEVLKSGCPPHAGMAIGFDRLLAVMCGRDSVRDVIAFPKSGKGEDLLVKSPGRLTVEQLEIYHLRLRGDKEDGRGK